MRRSTGFSGFKIKTLVNKMNKWRSYSSTCKDKSQVSLLDPHFVTGFVDGEGSFVVSISKSKKLQTGWDVRPSFQIDLHKKDLPLIKSTKSYFKDVGHIYINKKGNVVRYRVYSVKDLSCVIIPHFNNCPLLTKKCEDFELFKLIVDLIIKKEHLTIEGLKKIIAIKSSLNQGLSDDKNKAFFDIVPVLKPLIVDKIIIDPYWLAGFVSGEGSFYIDIYKDKTKLGETAKLVFKVSQHNKEEELMKNLIKLLGTGIYTTHSKKDFGELVVTKFSEIYDKVIPFFEKYKIQGVKYQDFLDFKKVALLMKNKGHLTSIGLEQIKEIKSGMNQRRKLI